MNVEYKKDMSHNFMILTEEDIIEDYRLAMIEKNEIKGLIPCQIRNIDNQKYFYYDITGMQNMHDFYENQVLDAAVLRKLYMGYVELLEELRRFLLHENELLLKPEYIFLDAEKKNFYFCYFPGYEKDIGESFRELNEYLLPKIDHKDSQSINLGYRMYRCSIQKSISFEELKENLFQSDDSIMKKEGTRQPENGFEEADMEREALLDAFFQEDADEEKEQSGLKDILYLVLAAVLTGVIVMLVLRSPVGNQLNRWVIIGVAALINAAGLILYLIKKRRDQKTKNLDTNAAKKMNTETIIEIEPLVETKKQTEAEEADIDDDYKTIFLNKSGKQTFCTMKAIEPAILPDIVLDKDVMLIGKMSDTVDIMIPMPTVSRIHAKVKKVEGFWFLVDLNSKNGTFVNQKELLGEEEQILKDGDIVMFADIKYQFINSDSEN